VGLNLLRYKERDLTDDGVPYFVGLAGGRPKSDGASKIGNLRDGGVAEEVRIIFFWWMEPQHPMEPGTEKCKC
jgi:hypothetical protein